MATTIITRLNTGVKTIELARGVPVAGGRIVKIHLTTENHLVFELDNGEIIDSGVMPVPDDGTNGSNGADGSDGNDGLSAYQVWLNAGNSGTEADFLAALKGQQGDKGDKGDTGAAGSDGTNGSNGADGSDGNDGLSAYQVWLNAGNSGTEADFLAALKGQQGDKGDKGDTGAAGSDGTNGSNGADGSDGNDGLSAYQVWLNAGNSGTEADFLAALKGQQGDKGDKGDTGAAGSDGTNGSNGADGSDGNDGLSAYQVWLNAGNSGTEADFLAALKGQQGDKGDKGDTGAAGSDGTNGSNGADGSDGNDGLSAHQIWNNNGNAGTETDFLDSLKTSSSLTIAAIGLSADVDCPSSTSYKIPFDVSLMNSPKVFLESNSLKVAATGTYFLGGFVTYYINTAEQRLQPLVSVYVNNVKKWERGSSYIRNAPSGETSSDEWICEVATTPVALNKDDVVEFRVEVYQTSSSTGEHRLVDVSSVLVKSDNSQCWLYYMNTTSTFIVDTAPTAGSPDGIYMVRES